MQAIHVFARLPETVAVMPRTGWLDADRCSSANAVEQLVSIADRHHAQGEQKPAVESPRRRKLTYGEDAARPQKPFGHDQASNERRRHQCRMGLRRKAQVAAAMVQGSWVLREHCNRWIILSVHLHERSEQASAPVGDLVAIPSKVLF
jgi:hypothetical protein